MNNPISAYTEKDHADKQYWIDHLIHPVRAYWGDGTDEWFKWEKHFQFYTNHFVLTDNPMESDVCFLPLTLNYYIKNNQLDKVVDLADRMSQLNKPLIIWLDGDHDVRFDHSNCIFLKYFGFQSKAKLNNFIQPGDVKYDLLCQYFDGKVQVKEKTEIPSIGFDGIASLPVARLGLTILKNSILKLHHNIFQTQFKTDPVVPMIIKRKKILRQLEKMNRINTNIKVRDSFAVGTIGGKEKARIEYINNIVDSDYTLCYRGAANYSLRLYETLCLGRIPLFINTDCVLPVEADIDWTGIAIWVEDNELDILDKKIMEFHHSMTNSQFREKQKLCRETWVKFLSKEGFIMNFHKNLTQKHYLQNIGVFT